MNLHVASWKESCHRPERGDEAVLAEAAKRASKVIGRKVGLSNSKASEQLLAAFGAEPNLDGYFLAKYLEKAFAWKCNATVVDALNSCDSFVGMALESAVTDWISAHNIQPKLSVGDEAEIEIDGARVMGCVTKVNRRMGTYTIKPKQKESALKYMGRSVHKKFEDLHDIVPSAETFELARY